MADTWLTIEQAAVTLGLSVRTVNRHMAAGKIQSRLHDGRREVLVQTPDKPADAVSASASGRSAVIDDSPFGAVLSPFASDAPSVTGPAIAGHATVTIPPPASHPSDRHEWSDRPSDTPSDGHSHRTIDTETVLALADNANEKAELAVSAYQALARATDVQFQHVRRSARFAWTSVAVMAVGVSAAVGWTTHHLTKTHVQSQYLKEQVQAKTDATDRLSAERETMRAELSAARAEAARAEGKAGALTDIQSRMEGDLKDANARAADALTKEAQARAEWQTLRDAAVRQANERSTTRPAADARADGRND